MPAPLQASTTHRRRLRRATANANRPAATTTAPPTAPPTMAPTVAPPPPSLAVAAATGAPAEAASAAGGLAGGGGGGARCGAQVALSCTGVRRQVKSRSSQTAAGQGGGKMGEHADGGGAGGLVRAASTCRALGRRCLFGAALRRAGFSTATPGRCRVIPPSSAARSPPPPPLYVQRAGPEEGPRTAGGCQVAR